MVREINQLPRLKFCDTPEEMFKQSYAESGQVATTASPSSTASYHLIHAVPRPWVRAEVRSTRRQSSTVRVAGTYAKATRSGYGRVLHVVAFVERRRGCPVSHASSLADCMQDFSSKPMPPAYLSLRTIITKKCAEAVPEAPPRPETCVMSPRQKLARCILTGYCLRR